MALDKQINRLRQKIKLADAVVGGSDKELEYVGVDGEVWENSGDKVSNMSIELDALCFERQRIANGFFDPVYPRALQKKMLPGHMQQPVQGKGIEQYLGREAPVQHQPAQPLELEQHSIFHQEYPHSHPSPLKPLYVRVNEPLQHASFDPAAMQLYDHAPMHGELLDKHMVEQNAKDAMLNAGHNKQIDVNRNNKYPEYNNPSLSFNQYMNNAVVLDGKHFALHPQKNGKGNIQPNELELRGAGQEQLNLETLTPIDTKDLFVSPVGMPGVNKLMSSPFLSLNGNTIWVSPANGSVGSTPQLGRRHFELLVTPQNSGNTLESGENDSHSTLTTTDDTTTTGILSECPSISIGVEMQGWNINNVASPQLSNMFLFSPLPIAGYQDKFVL